MRRYIWTIFIAFAALGVFTGVVGTVTDSQFLVISSLSSFTAAVVFGGTCFASPAKSRIAPAHRSRGRSSGSRTARAPAHLSTTTATVGVTALPEDLEVLDPLPTETADPARATMPDRAPVAPPVTVKGAALPADGLAEETRAPASAEPHDVLSAFRASATSAGEVFSAHLWLEDESSGTLRLVAATGPFRPGGDPEPLAGTCLGKAISTGVAAFCRQMTSQTPAGDNTVWRYAIPLSAGEARGVAALDIAGDEPDRGLLTKVAAAQRSVLTGALALHVAREQTSASNILLEATHELSRLIDPTQVVDALLTRAIGLSSAETGSVMLLGDDGRLSIAASVGLPAEVPIVTSMAEGEGIAGWVLATRQPVVVEDLECKGPSSRRHGVRSAVSVPIADDDGILGVLNVGNRTFKARFSRSHRDALETLGRMGAMALRNARALETSQELYFDTLKALAIALETKDPYSRGATERIVQLACLLAEALGMPEKDRNAVRVAALLHDVGMAAAGDVVAVTDRPLSTVEWGMVKVHPVIAADVLEQAPALREAIPIVYHHHERYDGGGYVVGLAADTIPLGARVLAVADAYVAMTSDRPYRAALGAQAALREMRANAGTQFDPDVVAALENLVGDSSRRAAHS